MESWGSPTPKAGFFHRLEIPKPFTRAKVFIAEPVYVAADADETEIENKLNELQRKLDELVEIGKQWRETV